MSKFHLMISAAILMAAVTVAAAPPGGLSTDFIRQLQDTEMTGTDKLLADIVANKNVTEVALNRDELIAHSKIFNFKIKSGDITNQKSSGRCWMFAGFNILRPQVMQKYKLKAFEFSQNYLMFWDKLEKANCFLQLMIDMAGRPLDDRELDIVMEDPLGDGGWWTYFADLAEKYGVVPKEVMPETFNSSTSGTMNGLISQKLKEMGLQLRGMALTGRPPADIESAKIDMIKQVYRWLVMNLGQPPKEFTWRYETTDSASIKTHPKTLTPQEFYKDIINCDLGEYVAIFDLPHKDRYKAYSLRFGRDIYERPDFVLVNVPADTLRAYAAKSVLDSTPVWFAADIGKENYGADGILKRDIYDYAAIYGTTFEMPKGDLIQTRIITANHAMTFLGVDTLNGQVQKWLVENSWGGDHGDKGTWTMYNDWFDRYVFGLVIHKKYLSKELIKLAEMEPVVLPPWDPMSSLNRLE
ncbi:MAG: C1 family peptidase [candidate division Zixibacteria bacterium]|nr:C1 family peptidase [candidate division Zixibacteria bacterium]